MSDDCRHCGHPRSVHHKGAWDEQICAVKGCDCYGYAPPMPDSGKDAQ